MDKQAGPEILTITLPASDWQLILTICGQTLGPYQRLGEVLQMIQRQAQQQVESENKLLRPRHSPDVVSGIVNAESQRFPTDEELRRVDPRPLFGETP